MIVIMIQSKQNDVMMSMIINEAFDVRDDDTKAKHIMIYCFIRMKEIDDNGNN